MTKKRAKPKILLYMVVFIIVTLSLYCSRYFIRNLYSTTYEKIARNSGFNLAKIDISGVSPRVAKVIMAKIAMNINDSIFSVSSNEMYDRITGISWIKQAIVKKNLPNIIKIEIEETQPIAVYQHDTKSILIDRDGKFIEEVSVKPTGLPLVSGTNANKSVYKILDEIAKFSDIMARLDALSYIRERRWNLTVAGVKVKLPETNVADTLATLDTLIKNNKLNRNEVRSVDLRLPGQIIFNGLKLRDVPII